MSNLKTALAACLALAIAPIAHAESLAEQTFGELSALVGDWEGSYANGRSHRVSFELTANDSVLVETWTMSPTRQSLTLYALDGDRLIATHYCPQGNQPRLVLTERDADERYRFEFLDGTNLQDPTGSHQHALQIAIDSAQSFSRSESYVSNTQTTAGGSEPGELVRYRRLAP